MAQQLTPTQVDRIRNFLPAHRAQALSVSIDPAQRRDLATRLLTLRAGVSAYLPRYLVEVIHADPTPGQAGCYFKNGTVMFADVSGFTAMSETLSVLGKEGAEEMTGIVNDYFAAMLEISDAMQGDLLKFGGDALMIFFEGDGSAPRALAASSAMQAAMSAFANVETSQGVFPLRMSIGIASGPVILLNLGSKEEMHFTVMGRTLGRMAQMEAKATAGQVVADGATAEACRGLGQFEELEQGCFLLGGTTGAGDPPIPVALSQGEQNGEEGHPEDLLVELAQLEALSPYIPTELLLRSIADPGQPIQHGSHRPVTTMFANFVGLDGLVEDLGAGREHEILAIAEAYLAPMSQILNRYGGTISRLDNYSVGQRILALFGALQAHEDDPERAVRAGVEMNRAMDSVNRSIRAILAQGGEPGSGAPILTQRIGLNTGFVFAGSVGSAGRHEYTVMGAQVNLTARLMSIAGEGELLIGGTTARHVEGDFALEGREAVKVKGISEPVKSFVVGPEIAAQARLSRLAANPIEGRGGELERSREIRGEVLAGMGRMLLISGDSGIGKTRLIDEIVSDAIASGMEVLDGACLSYGRTMTYHPWAEILRRLFGFTPEQDPGERIRVLNDHMQRIRQELFTPVVGQVMGLPIEDNDLTRDLDAKLRRQRVLDLVLQLLQTRSSARPLVVLIEDVHWADEASRDLMEYIGRNIGSHPILFLVSHRPDEGLPDWRSLPGARELALEGLSAEACLAVAQGILDGGPLSEQLEGLILEKGGGNPLFLGEVIRSLIDSGSIRRDQEGTWDLPGGVETVELPETVHGMIISRMDRLDPFDRRVLQVASVVGRSFSTPTLAGAYTFDLPPTELGMRIEQLTGRGLVERLEGGEQFRFTHLTTQEVVYESLSYELRRDLHRRIGTHYEETHAGSLNEWIDLLAYHYYEGHAWPKAAAYNLQAGQRAQREFANEAAISACKRVLQAAGNLGADEQPLFSLPAHEVIGDVTSLTGEYDDAIESFSHALSLVEDAIERDDQTAVKANFYRKIAEVYEKQSEFDVAFDWLDRGLAFLSDVEPNVVGAQVRMLGAGIYRRLGKLEDAIQWCKESHAIASRIDSREGAKAVAHANYSMSGIFWRLGDLEKALALAEESLRKYEEIMDPLGQSRAYNNLSNAYADLGDWDRAIEALEKCLVINERTGDIVTKGIVANNMATIYLDRGEWDKAYELYQTSREIWVKLGASMQEGIILSNLAQVHIYQGDWPEAESSLMEGKHIFETLGSEDYLPELERRWAELYLRTDNLEAAYSHALQAIEMASALEARLDLGIAFRVLGEVYLAQRNLVEAELSLKRSTRILRDLDSEYEAAKVAIPLAELERAQGRELDLERLTKARETFQRLGAAFDLLNVTEIIDTIE